MQVVIDIPDKQYEYYTKLSLSGDVLGCLERLIMNGIPLPKGHGDLIDRDELAKILYDDRREVFTRHNILVLFSRYNKHLHTIIEADKEE